MLAQTPSELGRYPVVAGAHARRDDHDPAPHVPMRDDDSSMEI